MSVVCASEYGGPSDPTSGTHGYKGDDLQGKMAFAELNMGTALGGLPYKAKLKIDYGGRSVVAEKLDIGLGGPGCGGHPRAIDLWYETAAALGFSGLAPVNLTGGAAVQKQGTMHNAVLGIPGTPTIIPGEPEPFNPNSPSPIPGVPNPLQAFDALKGFGEFFVKILTFWPKILGFFKLFFTREGIIRVGKVLIGLFLLLTGVLGMAKIDAGETAGNVAGKASKVAEVAAVVK